MVKIRNKLIASLIIVLFLVGMVPVGLAAEMGKQTKQLDSGLTVQQAVDMALKSSNKIKLAKLDIERGEKVRENAADRVQYTPIAPATDTYAAMAYNGLVAADIGWRMASKTQTVEEDKLVYSVFNQYVKVLKGIEDLDYARKTLKYVQSQWNIAILSYQQGMVNSLQKDTAEEQFKKAQNGLKAAEAELNNEYQLLDRILGLEPEQRPILAEKPAYSILKVDMLESEAQRKTEDNPYIWLLDQKAKLASSKLELHNWTDPTEEPYRAKMIDENKAKLQASDARIQMKQAIRTIFNNVIKLEQLFNSQQQAVKVAEESLRIAKIKYEIGIITATELEGIELDLQNKKKLLNETIYNHELLKISYEKPWAVSTANIETTGE